MTETNVTPSEYMTVAEVATALGLTRMTVYRMCQTNALRHIRTGASGKTYRIFRSSYDEHAAHGTVRPAPRIPGQISMIEHDDCPPGGCPTTCERPE